MHEAIKRRPSTCLQALGALTLAFTVGCGSDGADSPSAAPVAGVPGAQPGGPTGSGGALSAAGGTGSAPSSPMGFGGSGNSGTAPPPAEAPPTQAPPVAEVCPTDRVPFTPLRRLTRYEFANSARALLNVDATEATADIPVDEVTNGFSNNSAIQTVSSLHAEKYTLASEALAKQAVQNLSTLFPCDTAAKGEEACAREFARTFGRRAFRRAISAEDEAMFMTAYAAGKNGGTYAEGIEVMIRAALQSPNFIYRFEITPPANATAKLIPLSPYEIATRLSYTIWGTGPDDGLLDAAARGELATKDQVVTKARAMLADPKARIGIIEFFNQWVGTSRLAITSKNTTLFPKYSSSVRDGMMKELPAFMEHVLWAGDHNFTTLLTSQDAFVTSALAPIYGLTAPASAATTPQRMTFPANQGRAGILTQAGFLAVQAHPDQTSPVLRGKFVRATLMCQPPPSPPPDVDISPPTLEDGATARERSAAHASGSCSGCHSLMDPIGLAFENFDALGEYRQTESGKPIDVKGEIVGATELSLQNEFMGVRELADKLAASDLVRDCLATQWFRYALGRSEATADDCSRSTLQARFEESNGDLVELVVGLAETDAFMYRGPSGQ